MNTVKKRINAMIITAISLCFCLLAGCDSNADDIKNLGGEEVSSVTEKSSGVDSTPGDDTSPEKKQVGGIAETFNEGIEFIPKKFKEAEYSRHFLENRQDIKTVRETYSEKISELKKNGINSMDFSECEFVPLPDFENVCTYYLHDGEGSQEKSWNCIEYWLKKMGIYDKVNMDKEVLNESRPAMKDEEIGGIGKPLAKNDYDFVTGKWNGTGGDAFYYLNDNYGYVMVVGGTVRILSYGKVADYYCSKTGDEPARSVDPYSLLGGELVEKGSYEELKNRKYELFDGDMSVEDSVKAIDEFFDFNNSRVGYEIYLVEVFKIIDKYVYRFHIRRTFDNIPFTWGIMGQRTDYGDTSLYSAWGDYIIAVVCDKEGLDAYYGVSDKQKFEGIIPVQSKIIDVADASEKIKSEISKEYKCKVKKVELTYLTYELVPGNSAKGDILVPAWEFIGENLIDDNNINIYVDALTGDVCFYEYYKDL